VSSRAFPPDFLWELRRPRTRSRAGTTTTTGPSGRRFLDGSTTAPERPCMRLVEEWLRRILRCRPSRQNAHRTRTGVEPSRARGGPLRRRRLRAIRALLDSHAGARIARDGHAQSLHPAALGRARRRVECSATVTWFARFARKCLEALGTRVQLWVTLNEPAAVAGAGYAMDEWPPGRGNLFAACGRSRPCCAPTPPRIGR